ncbi:MAG TPA: hypothetical protein VK607_23020, partial [Kofleriaceae bacterium]|nr:hypothetical protein [Kofleriaceae bacterium]
MLNELAPVEHAADAVVLLDDHDKPVLGVIVEAQLRRDNRKRYTWPQYAMNARARHECPFVVVVLTRSSRVARWAGQPIHVGNGTVFRQRIIGPGAAPTLPGATSDPDLAVLWTMVHGGSNTDTARSMALAAITGLSQLPDDDRRVLYSDLVERALCTRLRKALAMLPETQKFFSMGHRRSYTKGIAKGLALGRVEGLAEGSATATAKALLTILAQRGLPMTALQQ